ncbi:MAG: AraC family transcriptional regulator [Spirochaetota bacterium]
MDVLDPVFNLFRISDRPFNEYNSYLQRRYFSAPGTSGEIQMNAVGKSIGIIPQVMTIDDGEEYASPFHRHGNLELILMVMGNAYYEEKDAAHDVTPGSVLFIDHRRVHRMKGKGPCCWASVRFAPESVESSAASLTVDALLQFRLFAPFVQSRTISLLMLSSADARRMAMRFFDVADNFVRTAGKPSEALRISFLSLLHSLLSISSPAGESGIARAVDHIRNNYQRKLSVAETARHAGMSVQALSTGFKKAFSLPFPEYVNRLRIEKAKYLVMTTKLPFTDIALSVGFYDSSHFTKEFEKRVGVSPSAYRSKKRY